MIGTFSPLPGQLVFLYTLLLISMAASCRDTNASPEKDGSLLDKGTADEQHSAVDQLLGDPVALTIATFNVHNFFDDQDDPIHEDDVLSSQAVAAKIKDIGEALRQVKADVLALQEIENKSLLERLNSQELSSLGYSELRFVPGNDRRGMNIALLSRFPIPKAISHISDRFFGVNGDQTTYGFSRDCLEVYIEPSPNRLLVLLINHLRATDNSAFQESINRRLAQAHRVREIADQLLEANAETNLAVIGDLNDTPDSETLRLIKKGTIPLSDALDGTAPAESYTFIYQGDKVQIDYLLLAPGLAADLQPNTAQVLHDKSFTEASDHYPVRARFVLK